MDKQQIDYAELGKERIITISDLIVEIIRKLWLVIVMAVIFALLLGGYKYAKDSKAASSKDMTEDISDMTSGLSDADRTAVDNVLLVQDNLNQQQEYADNSILMKINPYDESNVVLQYHFDTGYVPQGEADSEDYSNDLLSSYQNYVNEGALSSDLSSKGIDVDIQYLNELINCTIDNDKLNNSDGTLAINSTSNSFEIKVIHVNEKKCQELAEKITECLEEYQKILDDSVGAHTLTLVDQSYSRVVDKSLWTYKYDRVNSIVTMQEKLDTLKEKLNTSQLDIVEKSNKQNEINKKADSAQKQESTVRISKKYVAVGGLGGIVLACLLIVFCYIMRGTINRAEDIQYLYNLRILGELDTSDRKNIFIGIWNKIIGKKHTLTREEEENLLITNLKMSCEKNQIKKLLISGCGQQDSDWAKRIVKELHEAGTEVDVETNVFFSPDAFEKLAQFNDIVLVEKVRNSQYTDIVKEIEICMEHQIRILGTVVLGA